MAGFRLSSLAGACGHVQAVQDRAVQRFTATAQQVRGPESGLGWAGWLRDVACVWVEGLGKRAAGEPKGGAVRYEACVLTSKPRPARLAAGRGRLLP